MALSFLGSPYGIRTRVAALRGRYPRPLDERATSVIKTICHKDKLCNSGGDSYLPSQNSRILRSFPVAVKFSCRITWNSPSGNNYHSTPNGFPGCLRISLLKRRESSVAAIVQGYTFQPSVDFQVPQLNDLMLLHPLCIIGETFYSIIVRNNDLEAVVTQPESPLADSAIPRTDTSDSEIDREQWLYMYEQMSKIRSFEENANELYLSRKMPGLTHLYIGEEAVAVGVCEALRQDDYITSTHRGHGHCVAKGAKLDRMFAELLGKEAGYCRGKGGSMHIADQETGNLGANAIVGGSAGIATGAGLSIKMRGSDQVAVCFFGDGAMGQGLFYESANMAQLWKLPVIYVCENNLYGEYTKNSEAAAGTYMGRAQAFGILSVEVDGQDIRDVFTTMRRLVARARRGGGPAFLLCNTYRFLGHHVGDVNREYYRSKEEEARWRTERDPMQLLADWMVEQGLAEKEIFRQIEDGVRNEVTAAVDFALNAPYPAVEEVDQHVYA